MSKRPKASRLPQKAVSVMFSLLPSLRVPQKAMFLWPSGATVIGPVPRYGPGHLRPAVSPNWPVRPAFLLAGRDSQGAVA